MWDRTAPKHNVDDSSAEDSRNCIYEAIRGIGMSAMLLAIVVVPVQGREWKRTFSFAYHAVVRRTPLFALLGSSPLRHF